MRMTIIGKNPRAGGSECVVFGHIGKDGAFVPVTMDMHVGARDGRELQAFGGWELREMRPGVGPSTAPALVGWTEGADYCRTAGRLVLVSHRWSGRLQINDIGRKYVVDLYSEETRLVLLDAVNAIMVDVASLAEAVPGGFRLPPMTIESLLAHVVATCPWFRFLERDADFKPGWLRRSLETLRRPPDGLKLRLLAALLPVVAARPAPPVAPPPQEDLRLRDEMRLLAAAVEGLALRAPA